MSKYLFLYVPIDTKNNATTLSEKLIEKKLAACVNIIDSITSIYYWQDKIEKSSECIMLIKTSTHVAARAKKLIARNHPYDIHCIAELSIDSLNTAYALWLDSVTMQADNK